MEKWQDKGLGAWLKGLQGIDWGSDDADRALIENASQLITKHARDTNDLADSQSFERQPAAFDALFDALAVPSGQGGDAGEREGWAAEPVAPKPPGADLTELSLTELAQAIADRRVSSREATQACLDIFEAHGARLNLVAAIDPEAALADADAADTALVSQGPAGRLHGVPLAHKDMFYRTGRVSGCGSKILADFRPDHTATVLDRLDRAGALDIARLNMVEFAFGTTGHNSVTGDVRNPWNADHITCGSSSGPGAAIAARTIFGALGSDTGGSIRLPASCCGVVGLKATSGRVSRHGAMPLCFTLDTVGPMARTVADVATLLGVIAGHDPADPVSAARPVPDYLGELEDGVAGLKIAVPENYFYDPVGDDVGGILQASLDLLAKLGAELVPVTIPGIERANGLTTLIIMAEAASYHRKWIAARHADYGPQTLSRLVPGLAIPATVYMEALNLRHRIMAEFAAAVFDHADILHLPMLPVPVPRFDAFEAPGTPAFLEIVVALGHCTRPANFLGLPALSMPAGFTADGLPAAFQLVGRPFDEATLLRAARAFERETGITDKRPKL
ncbi:MAG: amidase [Alphaproteobacteria bacterium]|nr:amidase [Alphaproteobacteria bacterium]